MPHISRAKRAYRAADFAVGLLLGVCGGVAAFLASLGLSELLVSSLFHGASISDAFNSLVDKYLGSVLGTHTRGNAALIVACFTGALAGLAYAWRAGLARLRRLDGPDSRSGASKPL